MCVCVCEGGRRDGPQGGDAMHAEEASGSEGCARACVPKRTHQPLVLAGGEGVEDAVEDCLLLLEVRARAVQWGWEGARCSGYVWGQRGMDSGDGTGPHAHTRSTKTHSAHECVCVCGGGGKALTSRGR